jgi:uncharacterized protein (TIGR02246 family)
MVAGGACSGSWRALSAGVLSIVCLAASDAAQDAGPEALVKGFVQAWNTHDMKAFAALFTEDADFVNVAGAWWKGRAEIQAKLEERHATRFKATTLTATGTTVRLPRPDVAVVHLSWELTGALDREGKPAPSRRGVLQILGIKEADRWRITAAQNTNASEPQ